MGIQKAPQIKLGYQNHFGPKLGAMLYEIEKESLQLMRTWIVYQNLFDTNQERHDVMYAASGGFFYHILQESMLASTIMRAGRLTDPVQTAGQDNLTIQQLPLLADERYKPELERLVAVALRANKPLKKWRHKKFAHNDLQEKLMPGTNLPEIRPSDVQNAIDAIMSPLDFLNLEVRGAHRAKRIIKSGPTELDVLYLLGVGLQSPSVPYPEWLRDDLRDGEK